MLINATPADEIAEIRGQIRMLKEREADLRAGFLNGRYSMTGTAHSVSVRYQRQRHFCRDRLPHSILHDPSFWTEKVQQVLIVAPRAGIDLLERARADDDFAVIEPFDDWRNPLPSSHASGAAGLR